MLARNLLERSPDLDRVTEQGHHDPTHYWKVLSKHPGLLALPTR